MGKEFGKEGLAAVTNTKGTIKKTRKMGKGFSLGKAVIFIREDSKMISGRDTGKCTLKMAHFIKVNGSKVKE